MDKPTTRDAGKGQPVSPAAPKIAKPADDMEILRADFGAFQATVASDLQKLANALTGLTNNVGILRGRVDGLDVGVVDCRQRVENLASNTTATVGAMDARVKALEVTRKQG